MKISRWSRRFHDPWGNKHWNRAGSPIRGQYNVSLSGLSGSNAPIVGAVGVDGQRCNIDGTSVIESTGNRFVKATKRSVERLRR